MNRPTKVSSRYAGSVVYTVRFKSPGHITFTVLAGGSFEVTSDIPVDVIVEKTIDGGIRADEDLSIDDGE